MVTTLTLPVGHVANEKIRISVGGGLEYNSHPHLVEHRTKTQHSELEKPHTGCVPLTYASWCPREGSIHRPEKLGHWWEGRGLTLNTVQPSFPAPILLIFLMFIYF